jgi:hypothetical protein
MSLLGSCSLGRYSQILHEEFLMHALAFPRRRLLAVAVLFAALAGCATFAEPEGPPRKEMVIAITAGMDLIKFNAGQPSRVLERRAISGLPAGERLIGIDFRVARGVLYALAQSGRVYTVDVALGALKPVSTVPVAVPLQGSAFGFDFNPAVDRMRIVSNVGQNLRIHPDTGAVIDGNAAEPGVQTDGTLHYVQGDINNARTPDVVGAAYTYNTKNEKITTLYTIDRALGTLAMQGSKEGVTPFISPDTGQLRTVGSLGLGVLTDASFDISDVANTALVAVRSVAAPQTRLHLVDLDTGRTTALGRVGDGSPVIGMAIEP